MNDMFNKCVEELKNKMLNKIKYLSILNEIINR